MRKTSHECQIRTNSYQPYMSYVRNWWSYSYSYQTNRHMQTIVYDTFSYTTDKESFMLFAILMLLSGCNECLNKMCSLIEIRKAFILLKTRNNKSIKSKFRHGRNQRHQQKRRRRRRSPFWVIFLILEE